MNHNVYLLATDPKDSCGDVIYSRDTGLRVRIFCLDRENFSHEPSEIQLFAYIKGHLFAFETIGIKSDDALDIVDALKWYGDYTKCPDMEILPEDPRSGKDIAM
ncbi:MAG: hypothetical protein ABI166_01660 [Mucilaginibacter sp.]